MSNNLNKTTTEYRKILKSTITAEKQQLINARILHDADTQRVFNTRILQQIDDINTRIMQVAQYQANILDKLNIFAEMIDSLESRSKTMEQSQAQILDKMNVYAKMIDKLQIRAHNIITELNCTDNHTFSR